MRASDPETAVKLTREALEKHYPEWFEGDEKQPTRFMKAEMLSPALTLTEKVLYQLCIGEYKKEHVERQREAGESTVTDQEEFEKKLDYCKEYSEQFSSEKDAQFMHDLYEQYWENKPKIVSGELTYDFPLSPKQRNIVEQRYDQWKQK